MEPNHKLRMEIAHLSHLIATSNSGGSSTNQVHSYAQSLNRPRQFSSPPFHQRYPVPVNSKLRGQTMNRNLFKYPNPFTPLCVDDDYVNHVFQNEQSNNGIIKKAILTRDTAASQTLACKPKKNANQSTTATSTTNFTRMPLASTSAKIGDVKVENRPVSIYINPSYLTNCSSGESPLRTLSLSQRGIRPHINPAHSTFQMLAASCNGTNNCRLENFNLPAASSTTSHEYSNHGHDPVQTSFIALSTNKIDGKKDEAQFREFRQVTNASKPSASTSVAEVNTQYKLDRREKRSPARKVSKTKNIVPSKLPSATPKFFQRYTMRTVSASKHNLPLWKYPAFSKYKSMVLSNQHLIRKTSRQCSRVNPISFNATVTAVRKPKRGRKSVLHIDGKRFVRKNGGKTLKRMRYKGNVVNLNGNQFIRKNGGKSLKRLSESIINGKFKHLLALSSLSQQQTPGKRLATRAVQRSKITLSQRIWKKKRLCVFYNRFGECKRKDEGSCPYIHDRKRLMICPKFIVGKCTNEDCKLSHDLKVGQMPPCQFFNKSKCSRENCPYPHVKTSPFRKKSSETENDSKDQANSNGPSDKKFNSPSRKRKLSFRKEGSKSPVKSSVENKKRKSKRDIPITRYYEQTPHSQPVVSIIPRRLTKELKPETSTVEEEKKPVLQATETVPSSMIAASGSVAVDACPPILSSVPSAVDDRRMRLMSKISRLHERVKQKETTAPHFLPFN